MATRCRGRPAETAVAKPAGGEPAAAGTDLAWDAPVSNEPLSKQQPHAKVLEKGLPEDAVPGVAGRQVPFTDAITCIPGLLNSQGVKVRLTFKPELEQIWVGSATSTQKGE